MKIDFFSYNYSPYSRQSFNIKFMGITLLPYCRRSLLIVWLTINLQNCFRMIDRG